MTDSFPLPACLREPKSFADKVRILVEAYAHQMHRSPNVDEHAGLERALGQAEDGSVLAKVVLGTVFDLNEDWPLTTRNGSRAMFHLSPLP
ncbi:MAG: hypothetical protein ABW167_20570 [Baekduia sp.]